MRVYDIIQPPNEHELGERLRERPLSERTIVLTVQEELDELSRRRGVETSQQELEFRIGEIHLDRPTFIMGMVAIKSTARAARIDAVGDSTDDRENSLRLVVAGE